MANAMPVSEGFISFRGYRTWYHVVGDPTHRQTGLFPVLMVHGRPVSHQSLKPLERLAETGRPVVLYDQLGCGKSDRLVDPSLRSISLFVDEVGVVRRELGLEYTHLLGHSWGGAVVMEYALTQPRGIVSLTLASTFASRAILDAEIERLQDELPAEVRETLRKHEAAGTTDDPTYKWGFKIFALLHVFRSDPWPGWFLQALEPPPACRMNTEGWDIRTRLSEISLPTLVTCGQYDFATPAQAEFIHDRIPGSEWVVFEKSSHYPHGEETDRYLAVLNSFLTRIEGQVT